ncbi:hypothetical protein [Flavobacterium sp.]|uniref:hypothetical protein n=1 Tax=Flavobacterium sp. TaxID=239 RepID=UPI0026284727|nr:hypothetical protein [Flavobacterium sp.]
MRKRTVRRLEYFLHFLTALLLLIKGIHEISKGLYYPGIIIAGLSVTVFTIILFWRKLKIKPKQARVICWYLEAPALLLSSYMLYLEKKEFMPYLFFLAAVMYPAMGFISSKKFKRLRKSTS